MSKPQLADLSQRYRDQVRAQLRDLPRSRAVATIAQDNAPEFRLQRLLRSVGLPEPVTEFRFDPIRRWRFDYAWPDLMFALEVEGGIWTGGRHTRGAGYNADMEKYNAAALAGWRVLRTTPKELVSTKTIEMLKKALSTWESTR